MAVSEKLILDLSEAISQVADLERQLDALLQPIVVPVDIETSGALQQLQTEIAAADDLEIDIDIDDEEVNRAEREMEEFRRESQRTEDELEDLERQSRQTGRQLREIGTQGVQSFRGITGGLIAFGGALAAFQGARALGQFFADSIDSASDFEESLSKTEVVFGEFSDNIVEFSNTAPQALGLSNAAALELTSTFGNLFVSLGLSQQAASDLAPEIVQLGADLASFNNIEVADAVDKLRAGLVGEAEPLRALGVNINAAVVEAKALELGLVGVNGEVSEAAKVQARYALILEQTATAQGDFARTSEGIANRQRTITAEFENFRAEVGQALIPLYETLLDLAPEVLEAFRDLVPELERLATVLADVDFGSFVQGVTDIARVAPGAVTGLADLGGAIFGVVAGAASGDLEEFGGSILDLEQTINDFNVDTALAQLETGLIDRLRRGEDAAAAFEQQLLGLRDINLPATELGNVAARFAEIADVDPGELARLSITMGQLGEEAGFTADEVQAIREALAGLSDIEVGRVNFSRGGGRALIEESEAAALAALSEAEALQILDDVAADTDTTLLELLQTSSELPPEFQDIANTVSDSTVDFLQSVQRLEEVKEEIGTLPGAMAAARDALRDEQGEIVDDFDDFFDNLLEQLEARESFEGNLAVLRALGLNSLAQTFDEAGLEAANALADAVADPAAAARAEAELDGFGTRQGTGYVDAVREAIEGQPVTQSLVDNIIAAAAQADTPEVRAAFLALAQSLQLQIPVSFAEPTGFNVRDFLPEFTAAPGGGSTITNNFYTEPQPTTDTARIEQSVSSVVGRAR